jgi:hypothetical protein
MGYSDETGGWPARAHTPTHSLILDLVTLVVPLAWPGERIRFFHQIGPTALGSARRQQHEAAYLERGRPEAPASRQEAGNLRLARIAQSRQRDMRSKLATLRFQTEPLDDAFMFGLQFHQGWRRRDSCVKRMRLARPECPKPFQRQVETGPVYSCKSIGDLVRRVVVDVPDETQRDVVIRRIDPARAPQAAAEQGKRKADLLRKLDGGEQARHAGPPESKLQTHTIEQRLSAGQN